MALKDVVRILDCEVHDWYYKHRPEYMARYDFVSKAAERKRSLYESWVSAGSDVPPEHRQT